MANISKSGIEAQKTKKAELKARKKQFEKLREQSRRRLGVTDRTRPRTPSPSNSDSSQGSKEDHNAYIKKQAQLEHKSAIQQANFESAGGKSLYVKHREVSLMNNQVKLGAIRARQKLMPFIDHGFIHLNRTAKPKEKPL